MKNSKPNQKNINAIKASAIVIFAFIILLIGVVRSYFDVDLKQSDIIKFKGVVTSYKEERIGSSTRNHQVGFLKLNNTQLTFKISNASLRVLRINDFEKFIKEGETIIIGTTKEELERAKNSGLLNKLLNSIIDTRINPQTYFLSFQDQQYFDLDKYNEFERVRKKSNLIWGTPFIVIVIGIFSMMIYANWKTRFEKN